MIATENLQLPPKELDALSEETTQQSQVSDAKEKERLFGELVTRNRQRAYWMAYDILQNSAEAEDYSQEAFLRAYEKWDDFRGESSRDTWMLRILINLCLSHRRRRGLWTRISDWLRQESPEVQLMGGSHHHTNAEQRAIDQSVSVAIREAMAQLPEGQRTAFALRYLHDMSIQEIAEATGSAEGTIKSHLFRALRAMRSHLEALGVSEEGQEDEAK
ncbi:MAG: RNA polymerase sigma factor [Myxococcales bacterium]|nr:RNA polymerase sigma factor [Myxococcales bacterium]